MDSLELMVEEHKNIKRMLGVLRRASYQVLKGDPVPFDDFERMISFVRGYADRHHHGKEEELLFNRMMDEMGPVAEKLVRFGMLVEHDLGRLYMGQLEEALEKVRGGDDMARLDVISNAVSYTHLLNRHIDKEDTLVYPFARRDLKPETLEEVHANSRAFEEEAEKEGTQKKYLDLLEELEARYPVAPEGK